MAPPAHSTLDPPEPPDDDAAALLQRDPLNDDDDDLDEQLHQAHARRRFTGAEVEPVRFRHWELERRLGKGGMGAVYLGRDPELGRPVALKILAPPRGSDLVTMRRRLRREAQALARIKHPNVVQVYGVDLEEGRPVIEMEYVEGTTLKHWQAQPRPWREVVAVYARVGDGLAAIHAAGLVHRDVKPDNLLMGTDGRVKVVDLGLAMDPKAASREPAAKARPSLLDLPITQGSAVAGTRGYMAPEQTGRGEVTAASDQFGFAVSLYEALMGVPPYPAEDPVEHAEMMRRETLQVPKRPPRLPRWLIRALRRALSFDPSDRYPSIDALVRVLRKGLGRRRRWSWGSVVIGSIVILPGVGWALREPPCASLEDDLAAARALTDAASLDLRQRLDAGAPEHLRNALRAFEDAVDHRLNRWTRVRMDLCEAQARSSADVEPGHGVLARQLACLEHTRARLDGMVSAVAAGDADLSEHLVLAVTTVERLPACEDPRTLAHWPLHTAPEVEEPLAEALRLELAGHYSAAEAKAREAVQASMTAHPYVHAEARYRLGHVLGQQGRGTEAFAEVDRARNAAFEAGNDGLFCEAVAFQAKLAVLVELDSATSERELGLARACVQRTVLRSPFVRAELLEAEGLLAQAAGDFDAAVRSHEQALALREQHLGPQHFEVGKSLHNLANAHAERGDLGLAIGMLRRSVRARELLHGPWHPAVARTRFDLADAFVAIGALDDAARELARVRALYEHDAGTTTRDLAHVHLATASVELQRPQPSLTRATAHVERARALHDADPDLDANHPDRATLLQLEGGLVTLATAPEVDFGRALRAYSEATEILRRHDPRSRAVLDAVLKELEALWGLGDHAVLAARAAAEGPRLAEHLASVDPGTRGAVAWWIATASLQVGRDAQANEYLALAIDAYEELGDQDAVGELTALTQGGTPP